MDKTARKHPRNKEQVRRNRRITRKRSPGERPYSVMKRTFHGDHVFVTMIRRVRVNATFMCLGYNLLTLVSMEKNGKIAAAIKNDEKIGKMGGKTGIIDQRAAFRHGKTAENRSIS
jgi:IS5 family transposase